MPDENGTTKGQDNDNELGVKVPAADTLRDEAKTFSELDGVKDILEAESSRFSFTKKAYAIDKGHIRDFNRIKQAVVDVLLYYPTWVLTKMTSVDCEDKIKDSMATIGDNISPGDEKVFMPLLVDENTKFNDWILVKLNIEEINKLPEDKKKIITKRHNLEKNGLFERKKIKFSNFDLNTDATLLEDKTKGGKKTKALTKAILRSRTIQKKFNEKYGRDEEDIKTNEIEDENVEISNKALEKSNYGKRIKKAIELGQDHLKNILQVSDIKFGVPFIKLTPIGLMMDFMSAVNSFGKTASLKSSVIIKFGDVFSINYLGSELIGNNFSFGSKENIHLDVGFSKMIHDPSQNDSIWKIEDLNIQAEGLNADAKVDMSSDKVVYHTKKGISIVNGKFTINGPKIRGYKGKIEINNLQVNENKIKHFMGEGTINKVSLTSHLSAENISVVVAFLEDETIIDGKADVNLNSPLSPAGIEDFNLTGTVNIINDSSVETLNYSLTNGNLNGTFLGQTVKLTGVNYSSEKPHEITANTFAWKGQALGYNGRLLILKPKIIDNEGFNFKKITGVIYDISYGEYVTTEFVEVGVEKQENKYKINGTTQIEATLKTIPGIENVNLSGLFSASGYDDGTEIKYSLTGGMLDASFMGNRINLEGVKYSSEEKEFSANTFEWSGKIFEEHATFKLIQPIISNVEGFKLGEEGSAKGTLTKYKLGDWGYLTDISFEVQKENGSFYYSAGGTMDFNASSLGIPVNSDKYIVQIDKLNFNEKNASFESVSITGFTNSFDYGIFTLSPKKVILFNDSKKGFQVELDATMGNVFPSPFGDENSLTGHAKIKTGITSEPEKTTASFEIVTAHFDGSIKNPLSDLSILKGWGGNRMDIGASIMVFPGVFAEFGLFIESLLTFGGNIEIKATKNDNNSVLLHIDAPVAEGKVAAGAYAGVQAGSALLASFALYLEAYGEINAKLHGEFKKIFSLNEDTPSKKASIDLTLEGNAKVTAQLRAVARALLFFKKVWKYELASKNLGHFSYSTNTNKNTGFSTNTEKLVDKEPDFNDKALKEDVTINGKTRNQIKDMPIKELINLSTEDRWNKNEKDEIVDSFAVQENEIVEGSKIGNETRLDDDTEDSLNKYRNNRISLAEVTNSENSEIIEATVSLNFLQILNARLNNLNVYSEFINNRIDPKQEITPNPDLSEQKKRKEYHKLVNEKLNITQPFVNHYSKLVTDLISEISNENTDLANGIYTVPFQNNTEEIQTIENFKKEIFRNTFIFQSGILNESEMKKFSKALFSFRISKKIFQITMKNNNLLLGKKIGKKDTELRSKLANHRRDMAWMQFWESIEPSNSSNN